MPLDICCKALNGVKTFEHKNAFSVARRRSKRTGGATANNAINAATVAGNLTVAGVTKAMNFGQPTARASRLPLSSPRNTVVCRKTIYRHLRKARIREHYPQPAKDHGHDIFRAQFRRDGADDSISGQALSVREVKHETNALHAEALNALREKGIVIQSIVCDRWKELLQLFPEIPAQLCQFHQVKTVSRYLTRNPKMAAGANAERQRQGGLPKRPASMV